MLSRLATLALFVPLCLALSDASAAPSKQAPQPKNKPTPKTKNVPGPKPSKKMPPLPKELQPIEPVDLKLDRSITKDFKKRKPLSKSAVAAVAAKFSIPANPNDVLAPTAVTVRRPYAGPGAYLSFPTPQWVRPETYPDGVAMVEPDGRPRWVKGTGGPLPPLDDPSMFFQQADPLDAGFSPDRDVTIDGGFVGIHFTAAANRDYVVSCRVRRDGPGVYWYGVRVAANEDYSHMLRGLEPSHGRVSFAIERAPAKRGIDLALMAYREAPGLPHILLEFSLSRCDITPIE